MHPARAPHRKNIYFVTAFLAEHLVYQLPENLFEHFFQAELSYLESNATAVKTIQALVENNMDLVSSAEDLFIHRNTMVFRLNQLKKSLNLNPLHKDNDRFKLILLYHYYRKNTFCKHICKGGFMNKPYSFPYGKQLRLQFFQKPVFRLSSNLICPLTGHLWDRRKPSNMHWKNPHDTAELSVLAKGCKTVTVITSDHTRPMPSQITMPLLLQEIRKGNPDAQITILIATGCHRKTTQKELTERFGETIVKQEHIVVHNCDEGPFCQIGTSPSGNHIELNQIACEADLLIAEGFIEPHFFAGFSGGRKASFLVLPPENHYVQSCGLQYS